MTWYGPIVILIRTHLLVVWCGPTLSASVSHMELTSLESPSTGEGQQSTMEEESFCSL